jgi:hypothetical protein
MVEQGFAGQVWPVAIGLEIQSSQLVTQACDGKHVTAKRQFEIKTRNKTGKHTHALQGKLSLEPTTGPHSESTPDDTKIRSFSRQT